ncbi:MAG: DNA repair protein RadA, partial [Clostridia bacterium]|nr:DNA repair protein RadA [Clostridia bacterium]
MKKAKTIFVCQECGYESPKWMGQCICGQWNTMTEEKIHDIKASSNSMASTGKPSKPVPIEAVKSGLYNRVNTGINELNRVLGGGLVKGAVTLISGEPGIGKSTLILQAAASISNQQQKVLYITGEESEEQIKIRADRIGALSDKLLLLSETNIDHILSCIDDVQPDFLIIDSIQTLYSQNLSSAPGTVSQVRECANHIIRTAKVRNIPVFIVAHVTKTGELAGPRTLEHMVDAVLHFTGERNQELRILRSYKNRYGTTSEIGAFEMKEQGLIEFDNLSKSFLEGLEKESEGSIATSSFEGTRPLLLEIQALVVPANVGFARRTSIGIDNGRLNMIIAVLEKKAGVSLINHDVYINIVGG